MTVVPDGRGNSLLLDTKTNYDMKFSAGVLRLILFLCVPLLFWQCDDDDAGNGQLRIEITDAPIDDESIEGVFVTIAEVRVDGKMWTGMTSKQTIDLMTLQEGNVQSLGIAEVEAKSYNRISLVLDQEEDEDGNSPGCYVLTDDSQKHNLAASTSDEITIDVTGSDVDVMDGSTSSIVVDFDLRKSLRYGNPNEPSSDYAFSTTGELTAAIRYVEKNEAGHIEGECTDLISSSDMIVVYAYAKGTFDREDETSGPADEQFADAVTSTTVNAQGEYRLSWLEEGDYELVFVSYEDEGNNGTMDLQGTLNLTSILGLNLKSISVGVASTVVVDVMVTGILPI